MYLVNAPLLFCLFRHCTIFIRKIGDFALRYNKLRLFFIYLHYSFFILLLLIPILKKQNTIETPHVCFLFLCSIIKRYVTWILIICMGDIDERRSVSLETMMTSSTPSRKCIFLSSLCYNENILNSLVQATTYFRSTLSVDVVKDCTF